MLTVIAFLVLVAATAIVVGTVLFIRAHREDVTVATVLHSELSAARDDIAALRQRTEDEMQKLESKIDGGIKPQ